MKKASELTDLEAITELKNLAKQISYHNKLYYQDNSPEILDSEFDQLVLRNSEIEKFFPHLILPDSPSLKVGAPAADNFSKLEHLQSMLSLANAFSKQDLEDFMERIMQFLSLDFPPDLYCEPKFDGLSFNAIYINGILKTVSTRGDGLVGEDITANMKKIKNFPCDLKNSPETIEIRGEVYLEHEEFNRINAERKEKKEAIFANPRNAASGSLRLLDENITAERNLIYLVYGTGFSSNMISSTQSELMMFLKELGFLVNEMTIVTNSADEIMRYYENIFRQRPILPYDIDGVVYKVNNLNLQARLGFVAKSPRFAIAHKFPSAKAKTILKEITIQVGRTGALTPVAELEPINIGGVVVVRASLHNKNEIEKKDIRIGDLVLVERAGDVIPHIIEVDFANRSSANRKFIFPEYCPSCGSVAVKDSDEAITRCAGGLICPAQILERMIHFVSKAALNIEGCGEKQIEYFITKGLLRKPADIFKLKEANHILINELRWGEKSLQNLYKAIDDAKIVALNKFIYALGIRFVGESTAKLLAKHFVSFTNWYKQMQEVNLDKLTSIDGIGIKTAESIQEFFQEKHHLEILDGLEKTLTILDEKPSVFDSELANKTIVFTGTLTSISRLEAKAKAEKLGAKVASSISANTDFLVAGENAGSKLTKASALGVKILNEEEWLKICNIQ